MRRGAVVAVDVVADGGDGGTGSLGGGEQGEGLRRGTGGPVWVRDAMPAPRRAQVLAEELSGSGVEQADVGAVPLHVDAATDPAGRGTVVGRRDLDAAVEMHGAAAVLVVAERLKRVQREERLAVVVPVEAAWARRRAASAARKPAARCGSRPC